MRVFWLASTALLMSSGIALAQSSTMASPAPTGAISAPRTAPASTSPGNMAPAASGSGMPMASSAPGNGAASPAPNGAAGAPDVTASAPPATAPGKMAPTSGGVMAASSASGMSVGQKHHRSHSGAMVLPEDASATTYLHIARSAIGHHDVSLADDALSHAETRLLDRSVPQGQIAADDSPGIQSIESARQALHAGDYAKASAETRQAATSAMGI